MNGKNISGHKKIVQFMQALGFTAEQRGVCLGLTGAARDAILIKNKNVGLVPFINRYHQINQLYDKLIAPAWESTLNEMGAEEKVKRKIFLQRVREKVKNNRAQLSSEERAQLIQIEAFFTKVELYFQGHIYPYLFEPDKIPKTQRELNQKLFSFTMPKEIGDEEKHWPVELAKPFIFSGVYKDSELATNYFKTLRNALKHFRAPAVFFLTSCSHSVGFSYDPERETWLFLNPGDPPEDIRSTVEKNQTSESIGEIKKTEQSNQEEEDRLIAERISSEFADNIHHPPFTAFCTRIEVLPEDRVALEGCLLKWQARKEWRKAHQVTREKAKLSGLYSWLYLATFMNDIPLMEALLKEGADPNSEATGTSALFIAAQEGHLEALRLLRKAGASLSYTSNRLTSALGIALIHARLEIARELLGDKRNINLYINRSNVNGDTPLHFAAQLGNIEIITLLLDRGAYPDKKNREGESPIDHAKLFKHQEVVGLLEGKVAEWRVAVGKGIDDTCHLSQEIPEYTEEILKARKKALDKLNQDKESKENDIQSLQGTLATFTCLDLLAKNLSCLALKFAAVYPEEAEKLEKAIGIAFSDFAVSQCGRIDEERALFKLKEGAKEIRDRIKKKDDARQVHTLSLKRFGIFRKTDPFVKSIDDALSLHEKRYEIR